MPAVNTFSSIRELANTDNIDVQKLLRGKLKVNGQQYDVKISEEGQFYASRETRLKKSFFSAAKELFTHRLNDGHITSRSKRISDTLNLKHQQNELRSPSIEEAIRQIRQGAKWESKLSQVAKSGKAQVVTGNSSPTTSDDLEYLREPILKAAIKSSSEGTVKKAFIHTKDNKIETIDLGGDNIFRSQSDLIKQAKSEILFQTFQWEPNSTGASMLLDALQSLADNSPHRNAEGKVLGNDGKPIKVRILLDELKGKGAELMWPGVERPDLCDPDVFLGINQPWSPEERKDLLQNFDFELRTHQHKLINTLHSKTLVVDGKSASITGANVQERNHSPHEGFGAGIVKPTQFDLGMTLQGSVAKGLREDFVHYWNSSKNSKQPTHSLSRTPPPTNQVSSGVEMALLTKQPKTNPLSSSTASPQDQAIMAAIKNATSSISILSNNFNTPALEKALADAADRGVKVQILVPETANDKRLGNRVTGRKNTQAYEHLKSQTKHPDNLDLRYFSPIDRLKSEAFGTSKDKEDLVKLNPMSSHAKLTLIDKKVAIVGSANMDKTSWHHAGETNIALFDKEKTQELFARAFAPLWQATNTENLQDTPHRPNETTAQIPQHIQDKIHFLLEDNDN